MVERCVVGVEGGGLGERAGGGGSDSCTSLKSSNAFGSRSRGAIGRRSMDGGGGGGIWC
jgi:hypothetical protein